MLPCSLSLSLSIAAFPSFRLVSHLAYLQLCKSLEECRQVATSTVARRWVQERAKRTRAGSAPRTPEQVNSIEHVDVLFWNFRVSTSLSEAQFPQHLGPCDAVSARFFQMNSKWVLPTFRHRPTVIVSIILRCLPAPCILAIPCKDQQFRLCPKQGSFQASLEGCHVKCMKCRGASHPPWPLKSFSDLLSTGPTLHWERNITGGRQGFGATSMAQHPQCGVQPGHSGPFMSAM